MKTEDRLKIKRYINDPVYGSIGLTQMETELINTPAFQRLRGLRQLARVNYVFPGAEHSRFVHSLGVLYIMGCMTNHLLNQEMINEEDVVKMRAAALLHDIGHYPLSHLGENVYGFFDDDKYAEGIFLSGEDEHLDEDSVSLFNLTSVHSKAADHERLGKYIIENNAEINAILNRNQLDPSEIGDIFTGKYGAIDMAYTQLLHSSLDADRMDYLLRDSYQTGVRYGLIDLQYLIRLLMVVETPEELRGSVYGGSKRILVCDKKGQHVVDHFLMSRYFHYSQVIHHKTNTSFEGLIKVMYIKLVKAGEFLFNDLEEIKSNVNNECFLDFTDASLETAFRDYYYKTDDEEYITLYKMFRNRIRPKTIYEIKELYQKDPTSRCSILKNILKKEPEKISGIIGSDRWGYQIIPISIEKIHSRNSTDEAKEAKEEDYGEAIKLYDRQSHKITYLAEDPLSVINKLADYKTEFIRIYILDEKEQDYERMHDEIEQLIG